MYWIHARTMKKSLWLFTIPLLFLTGCYPEEVTVEPIYFASFTLDGVEYDMQYNADRDRNNPDAHTEWNSDKDPADSITGLVPIWKESSFQPIEDLNTDILTLGFHNRINDSLLNDFYQWVPVFFDYSTFEALFADENLTPIINITSPNGVYIQWADRELDTFGNPFQYYSYPRHRSFTQLPHPDAFSVEIHSRKRTSGKGYEDGMLITGTFSGMLYREDGQAEKLLTDGEFKLFYNF